MTFGFIGLGQMGMLLFHSMVCKNGSEQLFHKPTTTNLDRLPDGKKPAYEASGH